MCESDHPVRRLPDDISFERWVEHVFDHPPLEQAWWWDTDAEEWDYDANPARTLEYITRLFREPAILIAGRSRAQIDRGLTYLVDSACSDYMQVVKNTTLPVRDRCDAIDAIASLYEKLLAPVYGDDLGHTRRLGETHSEPNYVCYMFWDIICLYGGMDHCDNDALNESTLRVFERTLTLKSEACLESVLHGLGHWAMYKADRTEPIVRKFLAERNDLSPALRSYAEYAAEGRVQ